MKEKVILVKEKGIHPQEVKLLCKRLNMKVIDEVKPSSDKNRRLFLGKGKIKEIKEKLKDIKHAKVVIAQKIDPGTKRRLEKELRREVLDRGDIVIRIFDEEGGTSLLKHQTKKAKLERDLPKLRKMDSDQRDFLKPAHKRLKKLKKNIKEEKERKEKEMQRLIKKGYPSIALLGYTNAGKSTLFNYLISEEGVKVENELFTTLKHSSQLIEVSGYPLFIMDTLGLFKEIPHELLPAFHSTLYSAKEVDFPLLLLDASEPYELVQDKLETSLETLKEQGIEEPIIVLNKIDKDMGEDNYEKIVEAVKKKKGKEPYSISAKTGLKVKELILKLLKSLELYKKTFKIHYKENPDYLINKISELSLKIDIKKETKHAVVSVEGKEKPIGKAERIVRNKGDI